MTDFNIEIKNAKIYGNAVAIKFGCIKFQISSFIVL